MSEEQVMPVQAVKYNPSNYGEVTGRMQMPVHMIERNLPAHLDYILVQPGEVSDHHYVKDGKLVEKQRFPEMAWMPKTRLGKDILIRNVPLGTQVLWPDGVTTVETDGEVVCETDYLGDYRFEFSHPHYDDTEVVIHVTA